MIRNDSEIVKHAQRGDEISLTDDCIDTKGYVSNYLTFTKS